MKYVIDKDNGISHLVSYKITVRKILRGFNKTRFSYEFNIHPKRATEPGSWKLARVQPSRLHFNFNLTKR